jgi:cytochrome c-type biogenesis protein CcmH
VIFATLAVLMGLAAAAAVALPLWRGVQTKTQIANDAASATHHLQLAELERDLASGVLADADYRTARRDLETEWAKPAPMRAPHKPRSPALALATAISLMAAAGLLYWKYGAWRVGVEGVEAASVPAVEHMVEELSQRLHSTDQGDLQGWEMLGHAYVIMERYPDAVDAYVHARNLSKDGNADVLAGYAEAATLANPDDFMAKELPLFEKALQLDPRSPQALWYGGLGAFERGDKKLAVQRWQSLLDQNPPAEYRATISKYIVEAGGTPGASSQIAADSAGIHLHVILAAALQSKVAPDETVFVFAEAPGGAGGPPLAARRFHVRDLPLDLSLGDQDAVVPGRSLSSYADLVVTARISVSGAPVAKAGDLEGRAEWKKAGGRPLVIVIDTPVK